MDNYNLGIQGWDYGVLIVLFLHYVNCIYSTCFATKSSLILSI